MSTNDVMLNVTFYMAEMREISLEEAMGMVCQITESDNCSDPHPPLNPNSGWPVLDESSEAATSDEAAELSHNGWPDLESLKELDLT